MQGVLRGLEVCSCTQKLPLSVEHQLPFQKLQRLGCVFIFV